MLLCQAELFTSWTPIIIEVEFLTLVSSLSKLFRYAFTTEI